MAYSISTVQQLPLLVLVNVLSTATAACSAVQNQAFAGCHDVMLVFFLPESSDEENYKNMFLAKTSYILKLLISPTCSNKSNVYCTEQNNKIKLCLRTARANL